MSSDAARTAERTEATVVPVRVAAVRGAVAGLVGPFAVLVDTAAELWIGAQLVLHIAAAYGRDPSDHERVGELIDILDARNALKLAGKGLARRSAARRASRLIPGGGAVLAAVLNGRDVEVLAAKAARYFRNGSLSAKRS